MTDADTAQRPLRFFLDSVGCRLNQSEIEAFAADLRQEGHELVGSPQDADVAILNTCTVTCDADSASRRRARRIAAANGRIRTHLTGCWATLNPSAAGALPAVEKVVPNWEKDSMARGFHMSEYEFEREPVERRPIPGLRRRTRAFIKAQDGCDHHCTYCLTTKARGASRSLPPHAILDRVRSAVAGGAQEIVISGVQLSGYGHDLEQDLDLAELIRRLLAEIDVPRLRLSSLEPWGLPTGLFDLWTDARLCRQLHLPLQAGCDRTLKRMGRPISVREFAHTADLARASIPDLALTTDIIVGFPGEREDDFSESLEFIQSMRFADAHVFRYSSRPRTAAARLPDPVPGMVARERAAAVREVIDPSRRDYQRQFLGRRLRVLWERATKLDGIGWELSGLSDNYLRIKAHHPQPLRNQLTEVLLTDLGADHLRGTILEPC